MKKSKNFIILTTQRSGSTWLIHLLKKHPEINAASEIFKNDILIFKPQFSFLMTKNESISSHILYKINKSTLIKRHLEKCALQSQDRAFAFKLMLDQVKKYPSILPISQSLDYRFLILLRENVLHRFISNEYAKKYNNWTSKFKPKENETISIDVIKILDNLNLLQNQNEKLIKFSENNAKSHLVKYLDLVNDFDVTLDRMCTFLEISKLQEIDKTRKKVIDIDYYQNLIFNYAEVKLALSNSKYKHLIETI